MKLGGYKYTHLIEYLSIIQFMNEGFKFNRDIQNKDPIGSELRFFTNMFNYSKIHFSYLIFILVFGENKVSWTFSLLGAIANMTIPFWQTYKNLTSYTDKIEAIFILVQSLVVFITVGLMGIRFFIDS